MGMKRYNRLDALAFLAVCVCLLPGVAGAIEAEGPALVPEGGVHVDLVQPMTPGLQVPGAEIPGAAQLNIPAGISAVEAAPSPAQIPVMPAAVSAPQAAAVEAAVALSPAAGMDAAPQAEPAPKGQAAVLGEAMSLGAAARQSAETGDMTRVQSASKMTFDSQKTAGSAETPAVEAMSADGAVDQAPVEGRLQPSAPQAKAAAAPERSPYEALTGTWRKISGDGYADEIQITASGNSVMVTDARGYGYSFTNINEGPSDHGVWKGNLLAPGGTVTGETTTRFDGRRLESVSNRYETHWVRIPTDLVERRSLELKDGQLIEQSESTLMRKAFFYFGPYAVKSGINTSNLADPNRPLQTAVYERLSAPSAASQGGGSATATAGQPTQGSSSTLSRLRRVIAGAALAMVPATQALAATGQEAAKQGGAHGAALLGGLIGMALAGLFGWARRDKSSGGGYIDLTGLFNAMKVAAYGLGGGLIGAIAATAITHPAGGGIGFHPGMATLAAVVRGAIGFGIGGFIGWELRDRSSGGGYFDFTGLFNAVKVIGLGLVGAVLGAISVGLL